MNYWGFRGVAEQMFAINQLHLGLGFSRNPPQNLSEPSHTMAEMCKVLDCLALVPNIIQT